jgi:hypothetical protein
VPALPLAGGVVAALLLANGVWLLGIGARTASGAWVVEPGTQARYASMEQMAAYLRDLEPRDAPLATNHLANALWWYLYTGRPGLDAIARADGAEPYYVRPAHQGDPVAAAYFLYHRDNGTPGAEGHDWPVLQAALAARGLPLAPRYCTTDGALCLYDWQPGLP